MLPATNLHVEPDEHNEPDPPPPPIAETSRKTADSGMRSEDEGAVDEDPADAGAAPEAGSTQMATTAAQTNEIPAVESQNNTNAGGLQTHPEQAAAAEASDAEDGTQLAGRDSSADDETSAAPTVVGVAVPPPGGCFCFGLRRRPVAPAPASTAAAEP